MVERCAEPPAVSKDAPATESEARFLCSFVPGLLLAAMERGGQTIVPPTTRNYHGIALFAVRPRFHAPSSQRFATAPLPDCRTAAYARTYTRVAEPRGVCDDASHHRTYQVSLR